MTQEAAMLQITPTDQAIHPVDRVPPARQLGVLGLQHVLVMYAGAVAVPLIVGHALGLTDADIAFLISADLFACGLASMIQSIGLPWIGVKLPVMMGVTFASVAPMLAMISAGSTVGAAPTDTLRAIYGAVIVAGVFGLVAAPLVGRLAKLFPPVVTGTVILTIGISLMRIGVDWAAGGQPSSPTYGDPANLGIAAFVLLVILGFMRFARGFVRHVAVLAGLAVGAALCLALGMMPLDAVAAAPWVRVVAPFHFGLPTFDLAASATMCLVMLVVMIESFGMFMALGAMVGRPPDAKALSAGLRADGVGAILGGVFNTFPYTSFSQNVGLVGVTGVTSRWVCATGGAIMLALSLSPKLGALVAALPSPVLGGAGIVMFGMVVATGVKVLAEADLEPGGRNQLIVAVSVGLGMIPVVADRFFQAMPASLAPMLHSGILLATIAAVGLNLIFNGLGKPAES